MGRVQVGKASSAADFRWSVLPPLTLRGVGTSLVESAEHYAARLVWTAGTSLKQLCTLSPPYRENSSGKIGGLNRFCGPGDVYRERVRNLEHLTGVETIRCGTLMVLEPVLWPWALWSKSRGWCPECYAQWDDDTSWEPLIWQQSLLQCCPVHACRIACECRSCGRSQDFAVPYGQRRICRRCRQSLGWTSEPDRPHPRVKWMQRQLEALVELCATPYEPPVSESALSKFIEAVPIDKLPRFWSRLVVRDAMVKSRRRGMHVRAGIDSIIELCAIHGVLAKDMLLDPVGTASKPLLDNWGEEQLLELLDQRVDA